MQQAYLFASEIDDAKSGAYSFRFLIVDVSSSKSQVLAAEVSLDQQDEWMAAG